MQDLNTITFVTGNKGKIKDAETILGFSLKNAKLDIDEVQDDNIENIIRKKAIEAYKLLNSPLIVDDSGVYFNAWNGYPGPLVKFLDKAGGVDLVLKMLSHEPDRSIKLIAAVGFHDGKDVHIFTGEIDAQIAKEPRGTNGWSWDTIFMPPPFTHTFAEMTDEEKNKFSHRTEAFLKLKAFLK